MTDDVRAVAAASIGLRMTDVTCHVTAVKSEMTYALLLPVVVAAAVMVRAYDILSRDICHKG